MDDLCTSSIYKAIEKVFPKAEETRFRRAAPTDARSIVNFIRGSANVNQDGCTRTENSDGYQHVSSVKEILPPEQLEADLQISSICDNAVIPVCIILEVKTDGGCSYDLVCVAQWSFGYSTWMVVAVMVFSYKFLLLSLS